MIYKNMAGSLDNFFDKANSKIQGVANKLLGLESSPMMPKNHSGVFFGPMNASGVTRTQLISYGKNAVGDKNPNPDQGQLSPAISVGSEGYPAGFTPISYYSRDYDTFSGKLTAFFIGNNDNSAVASGKSLDVSNKELMDTVTKSKNNKEYLNKFNDDNLSITQRKVGENDPQTDFKFSLQDDKSLSNWPGSFNPGIPEILKGNDPRNSFTGTNEPKSWVRSKFHSGGKGTPYENEDPVYFGFEIIINTFNSPIFNGEAADFINQIGQNHLEIQGRREILESFNFEIQKFFKFNDLVDTNGQITGGPYVNLQRDKYKNLYNSNLKKRHYIKKIEGLEKLVEANTAGGPAAFVKWKTDLIKLTFYEDVTLSTGTLLNLYKLLYWSRKRGKGVLPENILRFDCEIIVSEIRNIGRVRSVINGPAPVDAAAAAAATAASNPSPTNTGSDKTDWSQFKPEAPIGPLQEDGTFTAAPAAAPAPAPAFTFGNLRPDQADEQFDQLTAPPAAPLVPNSPLAPPPPPPVPPALGFGPGANKSYPAPTSGPISKDVTESVDPQYDAKVLEIIKENVSRYRYNLYECQFHVPAMPHPGAIDQTTPLTAYDTHTIDISFKHSDMSFERFDYSTLKETKGKYITLNNGLLKPTQVSDKDTQRAKIELDEKGNPTIKPLASQVDFVRLDVISDNNQAGQDSISDIILGLVNSNDILGDVKEVDKKDKFKGALKNAGKNLLKATKTAVTNEAQRQLNDRFRLLNNTLEKVKQAYGLGSISPPTNVYNITPGSTPFYDVMNALRNFTGDVLGSALDLGG